MWGPYNNLATAQATCGSHTNILPDSGCDFLGLNCDSYGCSWDVTNVETPGIYNAQVGEVYVLLITNYASTVQNISLTQTSGTGATDCTILNTCSITGLTATPGVCNTTTNLFTLSGSITFTDAPTTGTLTVTNSCGGSQTFNAPFTSPQAYSIAGINSNGAACSVTATFSADPSCTRTTNYTAQPNCLPAACAMTAINVNISACDATDNT